MKSIFRFGRLLLLLFLCISFSGCTDADTSGEFAASPTQAESEKDSDFDYPSESDFTFTADIRDTAVRQGEPVIIDCSLTNDTNRDFYIEHGPETITYSYNDMSEAINAVAVLDTFKQGSCIERELSIPATTSGTITVTATIYVKPAQYADVDERREYTYVKDIAVTVA